MSAPAVADILSRLEAMGTAENRAGMARFGIKADRAFGVSNADLKPLARDIGRDHTLALDLWASGWREARILACFIADKRLLTADQARRWTQDFDSWEIVDTATALFVDAGLAFELIPEFAADDREFVRRAAFAMMAWGAVHLKKAPDAAILGWLPLIESHATDGRNFVRKAVNWALRQTGKRSRACHAPALLLARRLATSSNRTALWIGSDAVRELTDDRVLSRLEKRPGWRQ